MSSCQAMLLWFSFLSHLANIFISLEQVFEAKSPNSTLLSLRIFEIPILKFFLLFYHFKCISSSIFKALSSDFFIWFRNAVWSWAESDCQCRRHRDVGSIPGSGRFPQSRKWQPTQIFLPGKFYEQRSWVGYSLWGLKESDMTEHTHTLEWEVVCLPCLAVLWLFSPGLWGPGLKAGFVVVAQQFYPTVIL